MAKKIKVSLDLDAKLPLKYLTPLQGELKKLTPERADKLKKSILKHGFSFPFFVWENPDDAKIYIIDGTQRFTVLTQLKEEGYSIPQLPVVFIQAKDLAEAKQKLLAAASSYGEFTPEGIHDFTVDMDMGEIGEFAELPFINLPDILEADQETVSVGSYERAKSGEGEKFNAEEHWTGMPEFNQPDKTSYRQVIVHFDNDEDVADFFAKIGQSHTDKTKSIWHPEKENMDTESKRYGNKS